MRYKKILLIITMLVAVGSIPFWSRGPAANMAAAGPLPQDSPRVRFTQVSIIVIEPDAGETAVISLDVVISQAPPPGEAVAVTALSANGNANAGEDYVPVNENLTFPEGSTELQSFDVVIKGNNIRQPNRVFVVFLTNPVNATVSAPAAISITIVDNDRIILPQYLPIIRGHLAGPRPPVPTATPCYGYC